MRELQSVLKRRFFTDLIGLYDFRLLFGETVIGLRSKLNSTSFQDHDTMVFHG
jgi:hypothetical protein